MDQLNLSPLGLSLAVPLTRTDFWTHSYAEWRYGDPGVGSNGTDWAVIPIKVVNAKA